jgi:hypothetical protein
MLVQKLRTQPYTIAKFYAIKAARAWYGTDSGRFETSIMMLQIPYLLLIVLGSIAAWRRGGIAKRWAIGAWLIVLYFWGMTIIALSIVRYMVPVMGILFVLPAAILATKPRQAS